MNTNFLRDMLGGLVGRSRSFVKRTVIASGRQPGIVPSVSAILSLSRDLLSGRGEASGAILARQWLDAYRELTPAGRHELYVRLADEFGPDRERLQAAWENYEREGTPDAMSRLFAAAEPPRQELFRRLNRVSGGTESLVGMRSDLLKVDAREPSIKSVESDLVHLLQSWFNRGFLVMQRISWSSPADILERIIRYEAVHAINGWEDLRRRLEPVDRRCYSFFHPAVGNDPLIFVEVALTADIPNSIQDLLADGRPPLSADAATTAVFYSISNCQPGLKGISFGNFLIKQVAEDLSRDLPNLRTFVTLSPVPGFAAWLRGVRENPAGSNLAAVDLSELNLLDQPDWHEKPEAVGRLEPLLINLAAYYYLQAKDRHGRPIDPVARFHLGNGARLERINWLADISAKGLREGHGLMVNYLYDLDSIEANHEAFANKNEVVAAKPIEQKLREFQNSTHHKKRA